MHLARVIGSVVSTERHPAYASLILLLVKRLDTSRRPDGPTTVAVDYVGAGAGDTVLVGAAPGLASVVFKVDRAPMRELVMGIVDRIEPSPTA